MLNMKKIKEMMRTLEPLKLQNSIMWKEPDKHVGEHGQVTDGWMMEGNEYRLQEVSADKVKLCMLVNHLWADVMYFDKDELR